MLCQLHSGKPERGQVPSTRTREKVEGPGEHWELDFTEAAPTRFGYKNSLVFVDTYLGWVEAFPTQIETANITIKKLVKCPDLVFP